MRTKDSLWSGHALRALTRTRARVLRLRFTRAAATAINLRDKRARRVRCSNEWIETAETSRSPSSNALRKSCSENGQVEAPKVRHVIVQ